MNMQKTIIYFIKKIVSLKIWDGVLRSLIIKKRFSLALVSLLLLNGTKAQNASSSTDAQKSFF